MRLKAKTSRQEGDATLCRSPSPGLPQRQFWKL